MTKAATATSCTKSCYHHPAVTKSATQPTVRKLQQSIRGDEAHNSKKGQKLQQLTGCHKSCSSY